MPSRRIFVDVDSLGKPSDSLEASSLARLQDSPDSFWVAGAGRVDA